MSDERRGVMKEKNKMSRRETRVEMRRRSEKAAPSPLMRGLCLSRAKARVSCKTQERRDESSRERIREEKKGREERLACMTIESDRESKRVCAWALPLGLAHGLDA